MPTLKAREIAKIIGKTDKTIHNHRTAGKISMEKDIDGEYAADIAEVQRAYSKLIPNIAERIVSFVNDNNGNTSVTNIVKAPIKEENPPHIEEMYKELLSQKDAEIERMGEVYDKSLKTVDTMTKLLEHSSARTETLTNSVTKLLERDQNRENGNTDLLKSIQSLESRIANQEKVANAKAEAEALERTALEKQLAEQKKTMEEQGRALKDATDAELKREEEKAAELKKAEEEAEVERVRIEQEREASQTWISKMFGKKKTA